jgi:hypothetical protein
MHARVIKNCFQKICYKLTRIHFSLIFCFVEEESIYLWALPFANKQERICLLEVPLAMTVWGVTSSGPAEVCRRFGRTQCFNIQQVSNQKDGDSV